MREIPKDEPGWVKSPSGRLEQNLRQVWERAPTKFRPVMQQYPPDVTYWYRGVECLVCGYWAEGPMLVPIELARALAPVEDVEVARVVSKIMGRSVVGSEVTTGRPVEQLLQSWN